MLSAEIETVVRRLNPQPTDFKPVRIMLEMHQLEVLGLTMGTYQIKCVAANHFDPPSR